MPPPSTRRAFSRQKWAWAAAAAALLLAGGAALDHFSSGAAKAPAAEHAPASVDGAPAGRPYAAAPDASSAPAPPAGERGYVRRLVVVEPPEPGAKPRDIRDASVVAQETAVDAVSGSPGAASASLAPMGAPESSAGSAAFAAAGGPALVSAPGSSASPSSASAPASAGTAGRATRDAGSQARRAPKSSGSDSAALSAAASEATRLVERARGHLRSAGAPAIGPLTPAAVAQELRTQLTQDQKADTAVHDALSSLPPDATEDQKEAAVAEALQSSGEPSGPEDVTQALAMAAGPRAPQPSPQALDAAVQQMSANPPDEQTMDRLSKLAMKPEPKPNAAPPKGGVQAYLQYQDAFDKADRDYHLKPAQVVPFPAIETSLGRNTGKYPLRDTLLSIAEDPKGRFKPNQRKQAGHDLAAMTRLIANGDMGGRTVDQIYGSNMGAIGITQFLPSSWEAYGVAMKSGAHKNPWDFRDAVLSTANYLDKHHAQQSYDRAILSYNYSQDYLNKIKQYGANVAPGIAAVKQAQAEGRLAPGGQAAAAPRSGAQ